MKECRPKCQCICGCRRQPGKGCRRLCTVCNALVGPGCCWVPERQMCHVCDTRIEPDPEPSDAMQLSWTFPAFDATNDTMVQIFLGESHHGPCLLVDTGAFQNIAGSFWVQNLQKILSQENQPSIKWKRLDNPHPVSGVGKDIVYANWTASIPIMFPGGRKTTFNTLYMENSKCPGLLGMEALGRTQSILDLRAGKLHIYSGNTANVTIDVPKGSDVQRMQLVQSSSGHILLPCAQFGARDNNAQSL